MSKGRSTGSGRQLPASALLCPEARISKSTFTRDGRVLINIDAYIPYFLAAVNNALSRGASQLYLKTFGIGIVEWRVLSTLAVEPSIPASRICDIVALDKGATSRALTSLNELGWAEFEAGGHDPRRKAWRLNASGYALHDQILSFALERERDLIEGVDPDDLETFLRVMRIMRVNVDRIDADEDDSEA